MLANQERRRVAAGPDLETESDGWAAARLTAGDEMMYGGHSLTISAQYVDQATSVSHLSQVLLLPM